MGNISPFFSLSSVYNNYDMKLRIILLLLLFVQCLSPSWAIGEWQIFNSSGTYTQLAHLGNRLYTLCGKSIAWYDLTDGSSGSLNTASGLHGSDVAFLVEARDYLAVIYADGLVDALDRQGNVHDFVDLQSKSITGSRTINMAKACDNELFLACDFGVVAVDLSEMLATCTYTTSNPARHAFAYGDYLYYSSAESGLMMCPRSTNYQDQQLWQTLDPRAITDVAVFTDVEGDRHCWYTNADHIVYNISTEADTTCLRLFNNQQLYPSKPFVFGSGWGVQIYRVRGPNTSACYLHEGPFNSCTGYYAESDSSVYVLHRTAGLRHLNLTFRGDNRTGLYEFDNDPSDDALNYNDYFGSKLIDLEIDADNSLVAINGGQMRVDKWEGMITSHSVINTFDGDQWDYVFEESVIEQLRREADDPATVTNSFFRGLTDMVCDPEIPGRYYVGTLQHGLFIFDRDSLIGQYDATNTKEGPVPVSYNKTSTQLSALAFDDDGTLWTAYTYADCPLAAFNPETGQWQRHPLSSKNGKEDIGRVLPTHPHSVNLVWLVRNTGYERCSVSILYNPSGPFSTDKDESVTFSTLVDQDGNNIRPYYIYDICEDRDQQIWILTSNGPLLVQDPVATFNYSTTNVNKGLVKRIKIPRNDGTNLADYLMADVSSNCMVIDNYNRKWIGTTNNGVYLLSPDCLTEIEHFTTANSLLPADEIISMAHDGENNRLYISTGSGLACYLTDDLKGESSIEGIYCYPNPVRPDYNGELRVMGLMDHSWVSITTATGDLIYRTQSDGATVTWDLHTAYGERVKPGVYIVHGVDSEGNEGKICKFLVL